MHGEAAARAYAKGQLEAIGWVEAVAGKRRIDCDIEKVTSYVFGFGDDGAKSCQTEAEAAQRAGLTGAFYSTADLPELPFQPAGVYGVPGMVNCHPRKWVLGLAKAIPGDGSWIAEGVRATGLVETQASGGQHIVQTTAGDVRARHVVVATHFPIFDRAAFFARLVPVRENCVAGIVDASRAPKDAFLAADRSLSFRSAPCGEAGKRMLVLCGEKYRTGTVADSGQMFAKVADWGKETFGMQVRQTWATQDLTPPDGLPFIGRYSPASVSLWTACGFNQWGLSMGIRAAHIITSLILHGQHEDAALYSPQRASQLLPSSAWALTKDNVEIAAHFVKGLVKPLLATVTPKQLQPGEATISSSLKYGRVAAYNDGGVLKCVSATCTHLGCSVRWNDGEKSWDCSCHGSRFDLDGSVLHGPAVRPLPIVDVEDL